MTKSCLAILLLAASGFSASAQAAGDAVLGETVYVSDCVSCHASAARIVRKIEGGNTEEKEAWLEAFLADHHLQDEAGKADLIAYLVSL